MDEFIAAVEVLRHPELRGKPVIVGGDGDPTKRGVVSTASYEARAFGVRSAMPLRTALKRCPDGVFLAVDADHYLEASSRVMDTLRTFPAVVQVLGWDEAFMAVETDDPEALARDVQREVLERTDLWCSIGVGDSKHRAKLGSAFAKPRGVFRLTHQEWPTLMGPRSVEALWGIGKKTAAKLNELGVHTVDQLANADDDLLASRFGPNTGPWIRSLGTGEDDGEVVGCFKGAGRIGQGLPVVLDGSAGVAQFREDAREMVAYGSIFRIGGEAIFEDRACFSELPGSLVEVCEIGFEPGVGWVDPDCGEHFGDGFLPPACSE